MQCLLVGGPVIGKDVWTLVRQSIQRPHPEKPGQADLALGVSGLPANTQGLHFREIMQVEWQFVVSRDHPLTDIDQPLTEDDIQAFRAVVVPRLLPPVAPLTRRVYDQQAVLRVATMQQKIDAQVRGLGVGFLPLHLVRKLLDSGDLVALPWAKEIADAPLHLVWKTNNKGKALRWFVDALREVPALSLRPS